MNADAEEDRMRARDTGALMQVLLHESGLFCLHTASPSPPLAAAASAVHAGSIVKLATTATANNTGGSEVYCYKS